MREGVDDVDWLATFAGGNMLYITSNMKGKVSAGEFVRQFASLKKKLRPGESVIVTRRGQPVGTFTKQPPPTRTAMSDFKKDANRPGFTVADGNALLARMLKAEVLF